MSVGDRLLLAFLRGVAGLVLLVLATVAYGALWIAGVARRGKGLSAKEYRERALRKRQLRGRVRYREQRRTMKGKYGTGRYLFWKRERTKASYALAAADAEFMRDFEDVMRAFDCTSADGLTA